MSAAQQQVGEVIREAFTEVQKTFGVHRKFILSLKATQDKNREAFEVEFFRCVNRLLLVFKREPSVERLVHFICSFATFSNKAVGMDEEFLSRLVMHLLQFTDAKDKAVRFRTCQVVSRVLSALSEEADLPEELWEKLEETMVPRLRDKIPVVRCMAVSALSRLQDPNDADDAIVSEYMNLVQNDASKDVRKAVLTNIGITSVTLPFVLDRVRDVRDDVRKHALVAISYKVHIKTLSIAQRCSVARHGLTDRHEAVRKCAVDMVCKRWLEMCGNNRIALLSMFDVENDEQTGFIVAETIAKHASSKSLIVSAESAKASLAPSGILTPEGALLLRAAARVAKASNASDDVFETIVPELTAFAVQLDAAVTSGSAFVVREMLKIAAMLDMSDESGRRRLLQAVRRILCQTLDENGDSIVPDAIALLAVLERSPVNFWKSLGEFVCQVGPDGAPFPALRRALHIIAAGCRHTPRGRLAQHFPHHEQFLESHVLPLIACEDASCRASAVGALGSMGIVDAGIATNFLSLLAAPALLDEPTVRVAAVKSLFDIVLSHSLIPFAALAADAVEPSILECVTMPPGLNTLNAGNVILRVLFPLVEVEEASVRCVACEGFAKLLACGRLDDAAVLRHLLLQQFMPATKDDIAVRQCLSVFFPAFVASGSERAMMLARELVPTLRLIEAAPAGSSMAEVQSQQLIGYALTLLDPSAFATPDGSSGVFEPHQEIAMCAVRECLCAGVSQSMLKVLLKLISVRLALHVVMMAAFSHASAERSLWPRPTASSESAALHDGRARVCGHRRCKRQSRRQDCEPSGVGSWQLSP